MPKAKDNFYGVFKYYENINGKEKKVEKEFTSKDAYDKFVAKHEMPKISVPSFDLFGFKSNLDDFIMGELGHFAEKKPAKKTVKKAVKKVVKKVAAKKKPAATKKKAVAKKPVVKKATAKTKAKVTKKAKK